MIRSVKQTFTTSALNFSYNINNALKTLNLPFATFVPTKIDGFALFTLTEASVSISAPNSTSDALPPMFQGIVPPGVIVEVPWASPDLNFSTILDRYLFSSFIIQGSAAGTLYISVSGVSPLALT